jgi:hypothetical protein
VSRRDKATTANRSGGVTGTLTIGRMHRLVLVVDRSVHLSAHALADNRMSLRELIKNLIVGHEQSLVRKLSMTKASEYAKRRNVLRKVNA